MRTLVAMLLALPFLAGCITTGQDVRPGSADLSLPAPPFPVPPTPFTHLLCDGDRLEALEQREGTDCNVLLTAEQGPAAEVHLAANPRDPLNLVGGSKDFSLGEDERCGKYNVWSGVYWSKDGGRTWTTSRLPGYPGDARTTALSDYACGSDPVLAFASDGTVYYTSIHVTDTTEDKPPVPQLGPVWGGGTKNAALAVTRSRDGGATWDDPVLLATKGANEGIFDKQWIAVDAATGQVYVTYIDTGSGDLMVQRSDDGAQTWTAPILIEATGEGFDGPWFHQFGQVVVDPRSVVHYTYMAVRQGDDATAIYHRASEDAGATWSEPHEVALFAPILDLEFTHKYRIVPNPALAVDGRSGALYVAYSAPAGPGAPPRPQADLDHFVASSTDGGLFWSVARVSDDLIGPLNGQWMNTVAVGPEGTVHTTWLDYRDDPSGQSAYVYYAYSQDGGATWSRNARVSDVPFDGTGGYHQSGSGTIGDYMGLAVTPLAVHPFWADTRNGRNDVFSAAILAAPLDET